MITRKEFLEGKFKKREVKSKEDHPIVKLLKANKKHALKASEIIKRTKLNKNTVRSMLAKLIKKKMIKHKVPYFMWK